MMMILNDYIPWGDIQRYRLYDYELLVVKWCVSTTWMMWYKKIFNCLSHCSQCIFFFYDNFFFGMNEITFYRNCALIWKSDDLLSMEYNSYGINGSIDFFHTVSIDFLCTICQLHDRYDTYSLILRTIKIKFLDMTLTHWSQKKWKYNHKCCKRGVLNIKLFEKKKRREKLLSLTT